MGVKNKNWNYRLRLYGTRVYKSFKNIKIEVTGVVSRNLKNRKFASKNRIKFFSSIDQLYNKTKPDAFIIAVSELSLKKVLIETLNLKHLTC